MNTDSKGEVWIYWDEDSQKNRPMVIIGVEKTAIQLDVTFCKLTTHAARNQYDVEIENWKEIGLKQPSVARCSKIYTLKKKHLKYKVAKLTPEKLKQIKEVAANYILE